VAEAVIVEAVRTATGKRNGSLAGTTPVDLSAHVLKALAVRSGLDPALIDDVVWGCVHQVGEQAMDVSRLSVLAAGWPLTVAGVTIDRQCGSSQQSISFAAASVVAGHADAVVAGGVESMSRVPMGSSVTAESHPFGAKGWVERFGEVFPNQGIGAEMISEQWGFSRRDLDEFSAVSHEKAAEAQDAGAFKDEIAAITTENGQFREDEGIRRGTTADTLAKLKTVFKEDGTIHAGNASQISDGSAGLLITSADFAKAQGLTPIAKVHTSVVIGSDPIIMLTGPIAATEKALKRSGLSIGDIGAFEVNEAFAPVPMAWLKEIGADEKNLNPLGGAIALGHPLGASGARLATTLLHHMRANGIRYGLQTMCEGGGQANATIFELL
jgi:acetyl-CoA acyltransferase